MSQNKIQAVIFDFGGVLVDWSPHNLYRHYFEQPHEIDRFLSEINFAEWNAQQDKGRPFAQAVAELSSEFPQHARLISAFHEHWEDSIDGPIAGTVRILQKLKQFGYLLYGLSNWSAETFPLIREKFPFFDLLDDILLSGEVKLIKPDPQIFHFMLDKFKLEAQACLFIDDSLANIKTANELGFVAIHFQSPAQLEIELSARGVL
ncbi:MAG: HAD family phosphatase [Chloroflexi bacterium]|nr:HAD family phosphatase [Chloroflexota bacterium]